MFFCRLTCRCAGTRARPAAVADDLTFNLKSTGRILMAKNQNTFEKRRREVEKKQRAEDKRKRRQKKKDYGGQPDPPTTRPADDLAD
jgi:hypothetical protein